MANESNERNEVSELVQAVEGSKEFLEWRKGNKSAHLSSMFAMGKGAKQLNEWLLSYYDWKDDTFTTFSTSGSLMAAKEQAFKKGRTVPVLEAGSVKVEIWNSLKIAENVRASNYKGEEANTIITILQPLTHEEFLGGNNNSSNSDGKERRKIGKKGTQKETKREKAAAEMKAEESEARPVWNITYITRSFNVINIKIDAETGDVLNHGISGVMDFVQKDK